MVEKRISSTPFDFAKANLVEYIRFAKEDLTTFGANLDWDAWSWNGVGTFCKQGVVKGRRTLRVPPELWLHPSFIDFAKAYIRERHAQNPSESTAFHTQRLRALRLVEMALLSKHGTAEPVHIDQFILDQAAALARTNFTGRTTYSAAQNLRAIASLVTRKQLVPASLEFWVSPISPVRDMGNAVGSLGEAHRAAKLPEHDALRALAEIFDHDLDPEDAAHQRDIYTTSVTALLLGAPARGGVETHHLPLDLIVKSTDSFGTEQTGMRWEAGKGFGSYIKWIWSGMVPVVEIALDRLKRMTEEGRNLARWMEDPATSDRFYRHPNCPKVDDDEPLTAEEACLALGLSTAAPAPSLRSVELSGAKGAHTLASLWKKHVLPQRHRDHPNFPYVSAKEAAKGTNGGLKFSNSLFCMRLNQLHAASGTSPVRLWMPSLPIYMEGIRGSKSCPNIFDRHGYKAADGRRLSMKSHALRHLLGTEAQRGKLDEDQIAWWSGRANRAQNQVYNHMSEQERVDRAKKRLGDERGNVNVVAWDPCGAPPLSSSGVLKEGHWTIDTNRKPASCSDLDIQPQLAGIDTLYGRCEHDYALGPCEGFAECLDCDDHRCIKGSDTDSQEKLFRVKELLSRVAADVERAKASADDGDWGAQDWYIQQSQWCEKIRELVAILESETTRDGAVVRLAGANSQTHLHRVLRTVAMKALEDQTAPEDVIQELLGALEQHGTDTRPIVFHPRGTLVHERKPGTAVGEVSYGA